MGVFGKREAKFHYLNYVPTIGLRTNRTLPAKLGKPQHVEPKVCCTHDRKSQGGAAAYRHVHLG